jgi:hypothetical protein
VSVTRWHQLARSKQLFRDALVVPGAAVETNCVLLGRFFIREILVCQVNFLASGQCVTHGCFERTILYHLVLSMAHSASQTIQSAVGRPGLNG